MKNLLTAGLLLLSLTACRDRQDENKLPEATQTGANTGGCLVDGKVWVAKRENIGAVTGGRANMYEEVNGYHKVTIYLSSENSTLTTLYIELVAREPFTEKTYEIPSYDNIKGAMITTAYDAFYTDTQNSGQITFTKIDRQKQFFSGTFSFKAKNSTGKVASITDGRFDKKFSY